MTLEYCSGLTLLQICSLKALIKIVCQQGVLDGKSGQLNCF